MSKIDIDFNSLKYNLYEILNIPHDADVHHVERPLLCPLPKTRSDHLKDVKHHEDREKHYDVCGREDPARPPAPLRFFIITHLHTAYFSASILSLRFCKSIA